MNVIQTWLYLIGTPERARKLRARVDTLKAPELDETFGPEAKQCPTTVLFGAETSRSLYADPKIRPALDAWDTEAVTADDIRRWCLYIEQGQYNGPISYYASSQERVAVQVAQQVMRDYRQTLSQLAD